MMLPLDQQTLEFVFSIAFAKTFILFAFGAAVWRCAGWIRRREVLGELLYRERLGWGMAFLAALTVLGTIVATALWVWVIIWFDSWFVPEGGVPDGLFDLLYLKIIVLWACAIHPILDSFMRSELRIYGCCSGGWRCIPWNRMVRGVCYAKRMLVIECECTPAVVLRGREAEIDEVSELVRRFIPVLEEERRRGRDRWRSFALFWRSRTAWLLTLLFCVVFAANFVPIYSDARREADAAARLEEAGAEVQRLFLRIHSVDFGEEARPKEEQIRLLGQLPDLRILQFRESPFDDTLAKHLSTISSLRSLDLGQTRITDKGMANLSQMTSMRGLFLDRTAITGDGLRHIESMQRLDTLLVPGIQMTESGMKSIGRLSSLKTLSISNTSTKDAWLAPLGKLSHLESLSLNETPITDAGVETLAKFKSLKKLSLSQTQITDGCAEALKRMTHLEELDIRDTALSPEVVREVREALPGVSVSWEEEDEDPREDVLGADGEVEPADVGLKQ